MNMLLCNKQMINIPGEKFILSNVTVHFSFKMWISWYNKAGITATPATYGWAGAGAMFEVIKAFEQEQLGQRLQKREK